MKEVGPSKKLLLREVIRDDNSANNGEILMCVLVSDESNFRPVRLKLLEDQNERRIIPWEVDLYWSEHTLPDF